MAPASSGAWLVRRFEEEPAAFHAREVPGPTGREVWVCRPTRPALVLGSAQRDDVVDRAAADAAGVAVVRRRSGGGAVLVVPGDLLWVDVVLPRGDVLWSDDVGRAFWWLGHAWQRSLAGLGVPATVHDGPLRRSRWSDLVCFAGLGPGELTDPAGAKVVGMSQRRTRVAARFQCAALLRWDPDALLSLLALPAAERRAASDDLRSVAAPVAAGPVDLLDALLALLP